ncbi:hypothetical protein ABH926_000910 [Catenulispora sp. GP43]|uniref:hypothetical protein n=1 Tax=Catenulispora sp. GP43 TaxID=3156263 RepID=UPI0035160BD3
MSRRAFIQPAVARPPGRRRAAGITALASFGLAPLALLWTAGPAHASDIGGAISRSEVIARANDWLNRAPAYSQTTYIWDVGHTAQYRTDCQGFVDMAWHLASNPNTDGIVASGLVDQIATSDLQPGDELDDTADGHAILFDQWQPDHVHFSYFTFGGGASGVAPPSHTVGGINDANLAGWPASHYTAYRYKHIDGGPGPGPGPGPGTVNVQTFAKAPGFDAPGGTQTGTLNQGLNYVYCRVWGPDYPAGNPAQHNHYWLKTDLDSGNPTRNQYVPAYFLKDEGNDVANDVNGVAIPNC